MGRGGAYREEGKWSIGRARKGIGTGRLHKKCVPGHVKAICDENQVQRRARAARKQLRWRYGDEYRMHLQVVEREMVLVPVRK